MRTRDIAITATLAAVLIAAKEALAFLPNIEIVTALLTVYALVLGIRRGMIICIAFILVECFIWGFGYWVVIYLLHWPMLVIGVGALPRIKIRLPLAIVLAIAHTVLFGVMSSFVEIIMMGALNSPYFWQYFYYRYLAGITFFVTHIVSNSIILPLLTPVLYLALKRLNKTAALSVKGSKSNGNVGAGGLSRLD